MEHLVCPHCGESTEVTWSRYWSSAKGFYECPRCKTKSKFQTKPRSVQFISWVFQLLVLIGCSALVGVYGALGATSFMVFIPVFFFDKYLDGKYGYLAEIT